jgi:hypothetical protein
MEDRLPPYREPYMSEDDRMSIFDAVSFALAYSSSGHPGPTHVVDTSSTLA